MTINLNDLNKYLDVAKEAALRAGVVLKERFRKLCPSMIDEKAKNDFVTERENTYSAIKGQGAFKNGKRIHVSHSNTLNTSLVATGFPFRIKDIIDNYLKVFKELFMRATGIRRGGSACLDLAYTAEGIFGGFFECALSPWDMAAGALLVKEAGGEVTDFHGGNQYLKTGNIIAGSQGVHQEILKIIQEIFKN